MDVAFWESFGKGWYGDAKNQLKLNVNAFKADYGVLPKLPTDPENDVLFTWNGTTSGVMVPNADWIAKDRAGLVFCDATSAVFAQDVTISKLDVVTYSWQKVRRLCSIILTLCLFVTECVVGVEMENRCWVAKVLTVC